MNITDLCQELRNWFEYQKKFGTFKIENGKMTSVLLEEGQYFRIIGSKFNDGVWNTSDELKDEIFSGAIWLMSVPPTIIKLAEEISDWEATNADILASPFQSESFGGYSYNKGSGVNSNGVVTWQTFFKDKLNRWRKL